METLHEDALPPRGIAGVPETGGSVPILPPRLTPSCGPKRLPPSVPPPPPPTHPPTTHPTPPPPTTTPHYTFDLQRLPDCVAATKNSSVPCAQCLATNAQILTNSGEGGHSYQSGGGGGRTSLPPPSHKRPARPSQSPPFIFMDNACYRLGCPV